MEVEPEEDYKPVAALRRGYRRADSHQVAIRNGMPAESGLDRHIYMSRAGPFNAGKADLGPVVGELLARGSAGRSFSAQSGTYEHKNWYRPPWPTGPNPIAAAMYALTETNDQRQRWDRTDKPQDKISVVNALRMATKPPPRKGQVAEPRRLGPWLGGWHRLDELLRSGKRMANRETPRSAVASIYSLMEADDITISFVSKKGRDQKLSKGAAVVMGTKTLGAKDWAGLPRLTESEETRVVTDGRGSPLLLLDTTSRGHYRVLKDVLSILDRAGDEHPLVTGIDVYPDNRVEGGVGPLDMLGLVKEFQNIRFRIYNKGTRDVDYMDLPKEQDIPGERPTRPHPQILDKRPKDLTGPCTTHGTRGLMPTNDRTDYMRNAVIELGNILTNADGRRAAANDAILRHLTGATAMTAPIVAEMGTSDVNVYDNCTGEYLIPDRTEYLWGQALEDGYVRFNAERGLFDTAQRYVLVTKDTKLMLNGALAAEVRRVDECKLNGIQVTLVAGVPGCGKTRDILHDHVPEQDLILTQTKEALQEIRAEMRGKGLDDAALRRDYRTVSSFVINGSQGKRYQRVYIDEACIMHAGFVGVVAWLSGASVVKLYGDPNQIPHIDFEGHGDVTYAEVKQLAHSETKQTKTHRCPLDVCAALAKVYPDICTTNYRRDTMTARLIRDTTELPKDADLYLTLTQKEKRLLAGTMGVRVLTVHEAQGKTARKVALVKLERGPGQIYSSEPHAIVALTRHTETFEYLTVDDTDTGVILDLMSAARDAGIGVIAGNAQRLARHKDNLRTSWEGECWTRDNG